MTSEIRSINFHLEKLVIMYIFFSCQELVGLDEVFTGSPLFPVLWNLSTLVFHNSSPCGTLPTFSLCVSELVPIRQCLSKLWWIGLYAIFQMWSNIGLVRKCRGLRFLKCQCIIPRTDLAVFVAMLHCSYVFRSYVTITLISLSCDDPFNSERLPNWYTTSPHIHITILTLKQEWETPG